MSKLKITGIAFLILLLVGCLTIDIWYLYIKLYGKERVVSTTFEVGLQETVDGDKKYFLEVNSYDNCFEIKFNYILDENREAFFSQGLQWYNSTGNISFREHQFVTQRHYEENFWGWEYSYYDVKNQYTASFGNTERINYASGNDYETTQISTNPLSNDSFFKITLKKGEDDVIYLMKFKGHVKTSEDDVRIDKGWWRTEFATYYDVYDADRFAGLLFQGISSMPYGTDCATIFEFGNLFDYYEPVPNKDGTYDRIGHEDEKLIYDDIKSYYSIKVTKHKGNIQNASESLFNCVNGSTSFNISGVESKDFFYGRTVINVDNSSFDKVTIAGNVIALKLKPSFVKSFTNYSKLIQLNVLIDIDALKQSGYEFVGFTADSGLSNYEVLSCQKVETIDDKLIYAEVPYVS